VDATFAASTSERTRRDELIAAHYASPHGLQARMWKLAQKDSYETVEKQWAALREELSSLIQRHESWSEAAKHYANWLIYTPQRMAELVGERAPQPNFAVTAKEQHTVRNYLRRVIRRKRGSRPVAKAARSLAFDADMYRLFEQNGRQYITLMSLEKGKRFVLPLTGKTPVRGNIRVVLDFERQRVEVHYTAEIKPHAPLTGKPCGLDAGVSEVFTDELGNRYGEAMGPTLAHASDRLCDKGRKRNKLYQLAEKADRNGNHAKANRIRTFNLGTKTQRSRIRRQRAEIERLTNTALNQVIALRQPAITVTEKLDVRGRAKSKNISRRVSLWARSTLKNRVEFKASAEGFCRKQVNPAFSSQTCPACGFVHRDNRQGDRFKCLNCGHTDDADRVAAHNLEARASDLEIRLFTPVARVKEILLARFTASAGKARLERDGSPPPTRLFSGRDSRRSHDRGQPESETTVRNLAWRGKTAVRNGAPS
jgi:transposase